MEEWILFIMKQLVLRWMWNRTDICWNLFIIHKKECYHKWETIKINFFKRIKKTPKTIVYLSSKRRNKASLPLFSMMISTPLLIRRLSSIHIEMNNFKMDSLKATSIIRLVSHLKSPRCLRLKVLQSLRSWI
jgi:hypothetical protein